MAQLISGIKFSGTIDNLSAYTMRGSEKVIIRRKGGPKKEQIKKSPSFENLRRNNSEWAGCTLAAKNFRFAIWSIRHLADYNISGPLNGIVKTAQKLETEGAWGQRAIYFSKFKELFEGFNLNQKRIFDSVVRVPIVAQLDRTAKSAKVEIPQIWPNIHLDNSFKNPLCRFVVSLGLVSDVMYNENMNIYQPINEYRQTYSISKCTEWRNTKQPFDAEELILSLDQELKFDEYDSMVLGIGIEFGNPLTDKLVEPIKYSGSAKVMMIK